MIPRHDYHIHTTYLGCANSTMTVLAIIAECERIGVTSLGITDHLNSFDKLPLHKPIRQDIEALDTSINVYFGVELNFTGCDQKFAFDAATRDELGFQFAIGGIHGSYLDEYDVAKMVEIQHRHHLATCADPLVDILAHPYFFSKGEFDKKGWPWFDSMKPVPAKYARELGQAARDSGTAIEINACANIVSSANNEQYVEEYIEYLSIVAAEGPMFSTGSDAHDINQLKYVGNVWDVASRLGLTEDRIWHPCDAPLNGGNSQ